MTYKGTLAEVRAVQEIHPGDEVRVQLNCLVLGPFLGYLPDLGPGLMFLARYMGACHFLWPDRSKKYI